jgi:hypothetical protein
MENDENWAKAKSPEVEQAKDAFAQAQQAETLRTMIHEYATAAVHYGHVDRDWVNSLLSRMGAPLVTGSAQYKINAPIYGVYGTTVTADNRAEALEKFKGYFDAVLADGEFRSSGYSQGVFQVTATGGQPVFFSGPQDIEPSDEQMLLGELKTSIRQMLKHGVVEHGWRYSSAAAQLDAMGLELLPPLMTKTVSVPVTGSAQINVQVFEGDDDEAVQRAAAVFMARATSVLVKPEEIGLAFTPRPDVAGFTIVDDEDGADDGPF